MAGDRTERFTCPYCGDPYGLAPGPCGACFLNGCKRAPASPPPAAPGPGTGEDERTTPAVEVAEMWRERYERCSAMLVEAKTDGANAARREAALLDLLKKAEAERDEARRQERAATDALYDLRGIAARASAAEASLLALRRDLREVEAAAESVEAIIRKHIGARQGEGIIAAAERVGCELTALRGEHEALRERVRALTDGWAAEDGRVGLRRRTVVVALRAALGGDEERGA